MSTSIVSAPGKVLIAGGYLVLDSKYEGIVVATSARFYTAVRSSAKPLVRVRAPQFEGASWGYAVDDTGRVKQVEGDGANKFVQSALETSFRVVAELKGSGAVPKALEITIAGDNDFYSQRAQLDSRGLPRTRASLELLPPFNAPGGPLRDVHKTGLGSSAALTTSLVCALLAHTGVSEPHSALAHHAAQRAHCAAQGKLGSGFDVAAAVFGSMRYHRFDPTAVPLDDAVPELAPRLREDAPGWNERVAKFALPPRTRIMLADVDAGSDTPSLVGKVLAWRKDAGQKAIDIWTKISAANSAVADTLLSLAELAQKDGTAYDAAFSYAASVPSAEWVGPSLPQEQRDVLAKLDNARGTMSDIRNMMRSMGEAAKVPIEPPEQQRLLDACIALQGVIGGGVPGAGGYDAIWVLVLEPPAEPQAPASRVEELWLKWKEVDVSPLLTGESVERGARVEKLDEIRGLAALL
ncbi:phosphomevalonate kinase [Auricularia subglabra TFB-10046 SS5]|nr:phosphomevalonate kinase [Auricularia subglabra TFB-10046 SS5]